MLVSVYVHCIFPTHKSKNFLEYIFHQIYMSLICYELEDFMYKTFFFFLCSDSYLNMLQSDVT